MLTLSPEQIEALYDILEASLQDLDPRVRKNAIVGFRILYRRNVKLKFSSYEIFQEGLKDNYEFVRIETIKLIR